MSDNRPTAPRDSVAGLIERVTFFNDETGFAVLRIKTAERHDLVTVIGTVPSVSAGEWLTADGRWAQSRDYGLEFKAETIQCTPPNTLEGIEKYLGSGMVKGIGPVYAKKMVKKYGETIFDIIDNFSARLEEIDGIGPKRRRLIKEAWTEQKAIRAIMVFLHSNGVSTSRAVKIYKLYGDNAIEQVRSNPYSLARDIHGIGFKTADQIAQKVGIPADSLIRASAGLRHVLVEATDKGHCGLPLEVLLDNAVELLQVQRTTISEALNRSLATGELVQDALDGVSIIYQPHLKKAEEAIAAKIISLGFGKPSYPQIDLPKAILWCQRKTGKELANSQKEALMQALSHRAIIITGGPGVGKTTLVNSLLLILRAKKVRCQLCAPTGRAAKRLFETTGMEAKTIHRLLETKPGGGFQRNERNPLDTDVLIADECSMIDVLLMSYLLRALPETASLVLVGDADQLPSVGPGMVLAHLIESEMIPVVRLTEIFRQAAQSRIIQSAHRINQGQMPEIVSKGVDSDFYFVEREAPDAILQLLLETVKTRLPAKLSCDPVRDIQVLAPMNRGSLGVIELNAQLQNALNPIRPEEPHVIKYGIQFRIRDKVIQTENNYDRDVFNGDIGQIREMDPVEQKVLIQFDQRMVEYDYSDLDELALAYAITIHKSQGSEFPVVVMPIASQHYMLLQRNLIYTAITRGKRMVVVIGQSRALSMAVRNHHVEKRYSGLLNRMSEYRKQSQG